MSHVVIASNESDARANAVAQHHAPTAGQAEPSEPANADAACGGGCGCGAADGPDFPELDARAVPHALRHAAIFGALDSIKPGGGMILVAPHDPLPLLAQVEQRSPGEFAVNYVERGPQAWRLRLVRRTAV